MLAWNTHAPNNQFWGESIAVLLLQVLHDGLSAILDAQFFVNVLEMVVHGPGADLEHLGDFLIQRAPAKMGHYLMLAGGEMRERVPPWIARQKIDLLR